MPLKVDIGTIELWSGALIDIPQGWVLCDGNNGTPDLRDHFSLTAGPVHPIDDNLNQPLHRHDFTSATHTHIIPLNSQLDTASPSFDRFLDTTPASGTTNFETQFPPYYSLAFVMFKGP